METVRDLHPIPLDDIFPLDRPGQILVTMSIGQWDTLLSVAYDQGCILLELDDDERPIRAYRNPTPKVSSD